MPGKAEQPPINLVNFAQLRLTGTRTVEVDIRGARVRVTENLEEDSTVDKELGRARLIAQGGTRAAHALLAMGEPDTEEKKTKEAALVDMTRAMDSLDVSVTFDPRRIICKRIAGRFVEWNVVGEDQKPLPLDFDGLYDGPLPTPTLDAIFKAVRDEPFVGEASA